MAAAGLATAAVSSATQGAYDNAYIPAVYFGALLSAACVVELAALAAALRRFDGRDGLVGGRAPGALARIAADLRSSRPGTALRPRHDPMAGPITPASHGQEDTRKRERLLAYLTEQGPEILVPCHPFYSVLAGGTGHLHVMGLNDVYAWPRTITSDPGRDAAIKERFRESVMALLRDPGDGSGSCWTTAPRRGSSGSSRYYRLVEDLARSGKAPRSLTGYPCTPRYVWAPRGQGAR